jgi:hypothetical protein
MRNIRRFFDADNVAFDEGSAAIAQHYHDPVHHYEDKDNDAERYEARRGRLLCFGARKLSALASTVANS